jgi:hypothetical protein
VIYHTLSSCIRKKLSVFLIAIVVIGTCWMVSLTAHACELGWADQGQDGPNQGYAGIFGQMFCIPTETCPGGEAWPLFAEIWTNYPDQQCFDLVARIGRYSSAPNQAAFA